MTGPAAWTRRVLAAGADGIGAMRSRFDAWANFLTGMNTGRDKTTGAMPLVEVILSPFLLEILFHNDDIAARIVTAVVDEAFREPWAIVNNGQADEEEADTIREQAAELESDFTTLGVHAKFKEAMIWGRLYGLGAILIGVEEEPRWNPQSQTMEAIPPWEPLDWQRVRALKYLTVLDKRDLVPWRWYADMQAPHFGDVAMYQVQPVGVFVGAPYDLESTNQIILVHESRLIRFGGEMTSKRERLRNQGADYSVLQKVYRALQLTHNNWQSASALLADASQGVFKITGLIDMIAQQGDIMQKRMQFVDLMRSTMRAIVLDKDGEDFTRVATPFTGIPEMLDQTWNRLASAARMPKTILMGASKTGLNTDDSDMRAWYDQVGAVQRETLMPNLVRLLRVVAAARGYASGQDWSIEFGPLWQMTASQKADYALKMAQRDHVYIDDGVWLAEEVALNRASDPTGMTTKIDVDARKAILEFKMELEEENARHPPPPALPPAPRATPGSRKALAAAPEQAQPGTPDPKPPGTTER